MIDLIVAEAVRSFELNIDLFDEIQALSDAGKLAPSIIQPTIEEGEEIVIETIEIKVTTTEVPVSKTPKKKVKYSTVSWIGGITVAIAAIAVGASVYQRYYVKKN